MSDLLTQVELPGVGGTGLAGWGRKTAPEMIASFRKYHQRHLEISLAALAAHDEDLRVTVIRGSISRKHITTLQEGRARENVTNLSKVPRDVAELVVAARIVAFEDQSQEALDRLDRASEAFADRVPWDDEPDCARPVPAPSDKKAA